MEAVLGLALLAAFMAGLFYVGRFIGERPEVVIGVVVVVGLIAAAVTLVLT